MAPKLALSALALCFVALAGCSGGGDGDGGGGNSTTSGGVGVGGTVSGPAGGVGGNATVSGSMTNTTTGSNGTDDEASMTAAVEISDNEFMPSSVTVALGGTVTWTNNGTNPHTVTSDDGTSFDSNPQCAPSVSPLPPTGDCLTQGESYTETFTEAGSFTYHCKVHTSMTGTVTVAEDE